MVADVTTLMGLVLRTSVLVLSLLALPGCAARADAPAGAGEDGWSLLGAGAGALVEVERYADLAAMSRAAELVVVATIDSVSAGRTFTNARDATDVVHYVSLNLRVDEVLAGTSNQAPETLLSLQTESAGLDQIARLDAHLSGQRALFFLRQVTDFGGVVTHPAPGPVHRVVSSQGVISSEAEGRARTPLWSGEGFPADLADRSLNDVVDEVRQDTAQAGDHRLAATTRWGNTAFTPPPADVEVAVNREEAIATAARAGGAGMSQPPGDPAEIFLAAYRGPPVTIEEADAGRTPQRIVWVAVYHGVEAVGSGPPPPPGAPPQPPDVQISDVVVVIDAHGGGPIFTLTTSAATRTSD